MDFAAIAYRCLKGIKDIHDRAKDVRKLNEEFRSLSRDCEKLAPTLRKIVKAPEVSNSVLDSVVKLEQSIEDVVALFLEVQDARQGGVLKRFGGVVKSKKLRSRADALKVDVKSCKGDLLYSCSLDVYLGHKQSVQESNLNFEKLLAMCDRMPMQVLEILRGGAQGAAAIANVGEVNLPREVVELPKTGSRIQGISEDKLDMNEIYKISGIMMYNAKSTNVTMFVRAKFTVEHVRRMFHENLTAYMKGRHFDLPTLVFANRKLEDKQTLAEAHVVKGSVIQVHFGEDQQTIRLRLLKKELAAQMANQPRTVITVYAEALTKKRFEVKISRGAMVEALRLIIHEHEDIPPEMLRIICKGRALDDNHTLAYYGIEDGDTIYYKLRLFGGMLSFSSGRDGGYDNLQLRQKNRESRGFRLTTHVMVDGETHRMELWNDAKCTEVLDEVESRFGIPREQVTGVFYEGKSIPFDDYLGDHFEECLDEGLRVTFDKSIQPESMIADNELPGDEQKEGVDSQQNGIEDLSTNQLRDLLKSALASAKMYSSSSTGDHANHDEFDFSDADSYAEESDYEELSQRTPPKKDNRRRPRLGI